MRFVWDEPKRLANLDKHGLDFRDLEGGFAFDDARVIPAHPSRVGRARLKAIGRLHGRVVTVVLSPLGSEALSVVILRVADLRERKIYAGR